MEVDIGGHVAGCHNIRAQHGDSQFSCVPVDTSEHPSLSRATQFLSSVSKGCGVL